MVSKLLAKLLNWWADRYGDGAGRHVESHRRIEPTLSYYHRPAEPARLHRLEPQAAFRLGRRA